MNRPVTDLLPAIRERNRAAIAALTPVLYGELRRLASRAMARERSDHTLSPTALVNEMFVRIADQRTADALDRSRFLSLAARTMRRVLVDHARRRGADRRGNARGRLDVDGLEVAGAARGVDVLALDEALERLEALDARQARLVEIRFFGGRTFDEAAAALGVSVATAKRDWELARAWLHRELRDA
ncbi:MAG: ECF-type sigma factor [Planctomycetota bacterium JB042]